MNPTRRNLITRLAQKALFATATALLGAVAAAPAEAQAYVGRSNRECLVFVSNLTSPYNTTAQNVFYGFVEFGAISIALGTLGPSYNKVHLVSGTGAKRDALSDKLCAIASNPSVQAVDLVFVTHGLTSQVLFSDGPASMSSVRWDIRNKLSASMRQKLRMVFSTACYGAGHNDYWLNAGFKVASGGRRIYADSGTSFSPALLNWVSGLTFTSVVNSANMSDPLRVQDNAAKQVLASWGYSAWWDVNSFRDLSGNGSLRIYHRPY